MMIKTSKVLILLLSLVAVFGQDAPPQQEEHHHHQEEQQVHHEEEQVHHQHHEEQQQHHEEQHQQEQQPPACNCDEIHQAHQKCVDDWTMLDALRQTLEEQVRTTEIEAKESCARELETARNEVQAQLEQARGEGEAQVEQARSEGRAQLELARSESQRNLEQAVNEGQTKLDEAKRQAQDELSQCQSQHQELNAQFKEQGNTHRRLQESSQQLEETLASIKSEKSKLEKSLSDKELSLSKEKKNKKEIQRELEESKRTIEEMIAAKTIITIDYDLLNERIEEIKAQANELWNDFMGVVGEHLEVAKEKLLEFYKYLETEVYPQVKETIDKDVIPFCKTTWKQANDMWEELYSPYRPEVNKQIKIAKREWKMFYRANLEPHVKEYKLDVHAATAKKTANEYATLAHNNLVDGIKTGTGVALNFVKLEEGPDFAIDALEKLHANYKLVAHYIECTLGFLVAYYFLKWLFFGKKKKKSKKLRKQQWKEKQEKEAAAAAKAKQQQNQPKNKAKNGHKNSKKNK